MNRSGLWLTVAALVTTLALSSFHSVASEPPEAVRRTRTASDSGEQFMRAKLPSVHEIVDGLAVEDYARIEQGADELLRLASLSSWKVRRDPVYMSYSSDFENTAVRLRNAARAGRLEEATFAYMHLTVSCTACHRHVRGVVQVAPRAGALFERPNRVIR